MDIKIYDDIIPQYLQDFYEFSILGRCREDEIYSLIPLTCKYEDTAEENGESPLSFTHILKSSSAISPFLPNFSLIPQIACNREHLIFNDIIQARIFVTTPYETKLEYYSPHVDLPYQHTVVFYYVNDADGDTVFFDHNHQVIKSVSPKKGRLIIFDGTLYHGGGIPKKGPRCAINFNILTTKPK